MGKGIFLKKLSSWISVLLLSLCCFSPFAHANNNEPYAETPYINPFIPQNPLLLHYSSDYLYADAQLSDLLGFSVNTKVSHRAGAHDAFALELDYGANEDRIGFTWGHAFSRMHFLKFTVERLTQNLPFNFESGEVRVRVPQLAYGVTGAYLFGENLIKGVNANLYYANATSQTFDEPQVLERDGSTYLDYRHIAGGRSYGGSVGVDVMPWRTALIQLKLNYDQVQYTPLYQLINAETSNNNLGFTASINQLITPDLKINLLASSREVYGNYMAGVSWLPRVLSRNLETNLTFEHIESNNSVSDENIVRFGVQVDLEGLLCSYSPPRCEYADLTTWTNTPAVHMARVLATADELLQEVQLLLTTINPSVGVAGAVVQIIGQGFTNSTTVLFGNKAATKVVLVSDKQLSVTVPANLPGPVNVSVKNPNTAPVVLAGGFTYLTLGLAPSIEDIIPNTGPEAGGTQVTILGTGLRGVFEVDFGTHPATNIEVDSTGTELHCTLPPGTGTVNVRVLSTGGIDLVTGVFTYQPQPTISNISPNNGSLNGGALVTINGSGFVNGLTTVNFGNAAATSVIVISSTQLTCITPAGVGNVNVSVTTPGGTATRVNGYHYDAVPVVSSVAPKAGPLAGGTNVTITGSGFTGTTAVKFGASNASNVTVVSDSLITCTNPAGVGTVDVTVTNASGTSPVTAADQFTYTVSPAVTSITPTFGPLSGGTSVTITGTNFTGVTAVKFGTTPALITAKSATSITATSPAGFGVVDVTVTTPGGTSATVNADKFSYVATPVITKVSPNIGLAAGNTPVTLTGKGFNGVTQVKFGATLAANIVVVNDTTITCTSPAGTGTVDITVTNPAGTSAITTADQYTFAALPTITSIAPNSGPLKGGQIVTINGTGLTGTTQVDFGAFTTTSVIVNSDTQLTVTTPASPNVGTVNVTVHAAGGNVTSPNSYTYAPVPTISSFTPTSGPAAGGTAVTINGTGFQTGGGVSQVLFGSAAATSIVVSSDTSITVNYPAGVASSSVHITVTTNGGSAISAAVFNYN